MRIATRVLQHSARMQQRTAIITGASSGFGLLATVELARRGWRVVATMRDLDRRARLDVAAQGAGVAQQIDVRRLDVTDCAAHETFAREALAAYPGLHALINNAGFAQGGFAEDVPLEALRRQLDTNFFGHVSLTKAFLPHFRAQRAGRIVMVSSISGLAGGPGMSAYAASKFALEGWSESLRIEMQSLGVFVVLVEPGAFETDIWTRNAQIAQPEDSPNRERGARMLRFARETLPKQDAVAVARLIADVCEHSRPRLRYLIGRGARVRQWLRAALPWRVYERLVCRIIGV